MESSGKDQTKLNFKICHFISSLFSVLLFSQPLIKKYIKFPMDLFRTVIFYKSYIFSFNINILLRRLHIIFGN